MSASAIRGRLQRLLATQGLAHPVIDANELDAELEALMALPEVEREARLDQLRPGWRDG